MEAAARYPLMRSQLIVGALRFVRARGGDPDRLVRELGLPRDVETRKDGTLPLDALRRFFDAAARAAKEPLLGIQLARTLDRGAFGLLAWSSRLAPTVRDACRRLAAYIRLSNDTVEVRFDEDEHGGVVSQRVPGHPACLGRHGNEFFVAVILEEGRRLAGPAFRPERVWLAHEAPPRLNIADELGVGAVAFAAGENGVALSPSTLATPLLSSDPLLLSYLDAQARHELDALAPDPGLLADVRRAVRQGLASGPPSLAATARALGVSGRTLQRRLSEAGASFQAVVDDARHELARSRVAGSEMPIGEVASSLGYSDVRAFLRAFKRWTGRTPSEYRARRGRTAG